MTRKRQWSSDNLEVKPEESGDEWGGPAEGPDCVAYLEPEEVGDILRSLVGPEWGGVHW